MLVSLNTNSATRSTQENAMQQFIEKYRDEIQGVVSGFDRLVFRGSLRGLNNAYWSEPLNAVVAVGMEQYLSTNHILFKDYAEHVKRASEQLKKASLRPFQQQHLPVEFVRSPQVDKDALARRIAAEKGIRTGPVCAIGSLEPSPTFEHRRTHMIRRIRPCGVLYQYQIHPEVGWMYARIQTWFAFNIQIGINGREWLARQMDRTGVHYRQQGNCFVWMEDYGEAQTLLNQQLQTNWAELLQGFARQLNPVHESLFEQFPTDYYWTVYQSEWATDVVFSQPDVLKRLMPLLVRHGMLTYQSADVMRYFGRKVNQSGAIPAQFAGVVEIDFKRRQEGERVKYRLNGNSAKFYDKAYSEYGSVLRAAETTINTVQDFRVYRPKQGGPEDDLQWRPLRKGIADLHRRTEVAQKSNERLMNALAAVDDSRSVEELTAEIQKPVVWSGRRMRALRPWGDDHALLRAINHGDFLINGFRNRNLQELLYAGPARSESERRRRSAGISRKLRLLRSHGLIQKVPRTHRYQIAEKGRVILVAVITTSRTTLHELNQLGAAA
jgi:hypothetical protein